MAPGYDTELVLVLVRISIVKSDPLVEDSSAASFPEAAGDPV